LQAPEAKKVRFRRGCRIRRRTSAFAPAAAKKVRHRRIKKAAGERAAFGLAVRCGKLEPAFSLDLRKKLSQNPSLHPLNAGSCSRIKI
jgi:hypothetical protein